MIMETPYQQLAALSPEQQALFEQKLAERGITPPQRDSIPRRHVEDNLPLSFAQQRLWFVQQLEPDNNAYNVASAFNIRGALDMAALEQALNVIIERHETLRTTFEVNADQQPIQVIHPFQPLSIPVIDRQGVAHAEADIQQRIEQLSRQPFDLTQPLLRLALYKLQADEHVLALTTHHIISDRWSVMIFLREMTLLYQAFATEQQSSLPPLPIQYADWAIWQRQQLQGDLLQRQLDYWTQQLGGELPILELPLDRPRPAMPTYRGAHYPIALSAELSANLKALSHRSEVTLFTLLLAAFQVLLHRYSASDDIIVGSEIANRSRSETEGLIGLFVNTLVLRADLSGNPRFSDLLTRVRDGVLGALAHQDLPFEQLVEVLAPERHLSQMMPLFQAKFDLQQAPVKPMELAGVTLERRVLEETNTKYELRFNLQDGDDGISGQVEYSTDLFDASTIARMVQHFEVLLAGIVAQPQQVLSALPLLTASERHTLLVDWNQTQCDFPTDACIHQLFEAQAERTPNAVALIAGHRTLTYRDLNVQANRLAYHLRDLGVRPEAPVGVCMGRSPEMVIGLLAILKAGGSYVPLDPDYPAERLAFIVDDARLEVLLQNGEYDLFTLRNSLTQIDLRTPDRLDINPNPGTGNLDSGVTPEHLAYVIYTSGSTGWPKGVAIEHHSAVTMLHWVKEQFGSDELAGVLASTSICFDLSVFEIFAPLSWGGSVILADNVLALPELPRAAEVTLINTVPSAMAQFLTLGTVPSSVRTVNLAGEAFPPTLLQRLQQLPHLQHIYNLYGPSEDTTYSTYASLDAEAIDAAAHIVPIGRPIANTQAYVLDETGQPVPIGVVGELYLGGAGLVRGYLNQPALTAEQFVSSPFDPQQRLYRTGDRARYRADGQLEFLGRFDHQVKIRGYRIETGEIEAVLNRHPDLRETVVVAHPEDEDIRLVAYVTLAATEASRPEPTVTEWRQFLAERLPTYMLPNLFVELPELPRLPNGKIDRHALPAPEALRPELAISYVKPRTRLETLLADIWCQALHLTQVGVHDNFFELGGHSLLGIKIVAQAEAALQRAIPLRYLFQAPILAEFATLLETSAGEAASATQRPTLVATPQQRYDPFPLTDMQQAYLLGRNRGFELGNVATHGYREIDVVGLSVSQVEDAVNRLIARHDMLRAIVTADGQQQVLPEVKIPAYVIAVTDLRSATPQQCDVQLTAIRERLSHQVLSPEHWPLFHIEAAQLKDDRVRFYISFDVLIGDAWSFQVLAWEMAQCLQGVELSPLTLAFRDYVLAEEVFHETPAYQQDVTYWRERLATLPAAPELPLAVAPGNIEQPHFIRRSGTLNAAAWGQLKQRAAEADLTPSGLLLAAFAEILALWSRHPQFTLNLTLFNRLPLHPEVDRLVGDFTSSLLLAMDQAGHEPLVTRARRIQTQLWEDLEHHNVSGVRVLRELAQAQQRAASALMPVVFTSILGQTAPPSTVRSWQTKVVYGVSQTSQVYLDHQVAEIDGALVFNWDTIDALFPDGLLDEMFRAYSDLLARLAEDAALWQASPRTHVFARQMPHVATLNQSDVPLFDPDREPLLQTLFFERVQQQPDAIAVIAGETTLTYSDLKRQVQHLAQQLRQLQVQPHQLVGITMEKGWEQVVATLAILTAGAAYVPIDPELPEARRGHLLEATHAAIVLTQPHLDHALIWPDSVTRWCVEYIAAATAETPAVPLVQQPTDLAYVIYTSGSTGLPKGVMIDHRGAVNTVLDINRRFQIVPGDRLLGLSSLSFDLSVYDIFGTLAAGATLVLPAASDIHNPAHWLQLLMQHQVTVWNSVPALMQLLMDELEQTPPSSGVPALRQVWLSGDWIPLSLPDRITAGCPAAQVISMGGATEASIWSIYYPVTTVDPDWKSIPYGRPLANQQWYVLNDDLDPCPVWATGDLYIAGVGLAQGYWDDPDKTQASFIMHPRSQERLYKTGDLGRYLPDGTIEFLGREDSQVKINGYRIELGEIETALQQHPAIQSAVVTAVGESREAQQLAAYLIPSDTVTALSGQQPLDVLCDPFARLDFKLQRRGVRELTPEQPGVDLPISADDRTPAYLRRQSFRRYLEEPVPLIALSEWLACLHALPLSTSPLPKYRYASAGSLYPVQAYLHVKPQRVNGLEGGFYYYHPEAHRLVNVSDGVELSGPEVSAVYGVNQPLFEQAAFALFLVAQFQAITPIYGEQSRDFCLLEAGYMGQLLMETAAECDLGLCPLGGLGAEPLQAAFGLGVEHHLLHGFVGGAIDPAWMQQPPAAPRSAVSITDALRQYLSDKLPAYMVPVSYHILESLPLNANGKVDRQALPTPASLTADMPFVAPRNDIEQAIVNIWQTVLELDQVSIHENFFEVGGNSLMLIQLLSQIRQTFQTELAIRDVFMAPTPAELAELLAAQPHEVAPPAGSEEAIIPIERQDAQAVLERLDDMSEEEVERLLHQTLADEEDPS